MYCTVQAGLELGEDLAAKTVYELIYECGMRSEDRRIERMVQRTGCSDLGGSQVFISFICSFIHLCCTLIEYCTVLYSTSSPASGVAVPLHQEKEMQCARHIHMHEEIVVC
jgi:hypothetical protein